MKRKNGNQISNSSSTAKKAHQSDFKRLKAKVGKSAPKAANYTDTRFQTAGLKVKEQQLETPQHQSSTTTTTTTVCSSKGNSLESLLFQLNHHHAPAARISALKGIQDVLVTSSSTTAAVIISHLASLIPSLSKCAFVDTDPTVRTIGRDLLHIVFVSTTTRCRSSNNNNSFQSGAAVLLDPFLPLYIAYVSSAFNSLHEDIRQDVTHGVLLATQFFTSSSSESTKHVAVARLLPSYARLISNSSSSLSVTTNINKVSKNRKKNRNANKAKDKAKSSNTTNSKVISQRCQILKSLKALFQWSTTTKDTNSKDAMRNNNFNTSSLMIYEGIVSNENTFNAAMDSNHWIRIISGPNAPMNAVVLINETDPLNERRSNITPLPTLKDLFTSYHNSNDEWTKISATACGASTIVSTSERKTKSNGVLSVSEDTVTALLNSLVDCWVEVIQHGISSTRGGTILSCCYIEELSYILSCLHELWSKILQSSIDNSLDKVARIQTHLLEAFPIKDDSGVEANIPLYNRLNASICFLLSDIIGGTAASATVSSKFVAAKTTMTLERIFAYMIPQLGELMMENSNGSVTKRGQPANNQENVDDENNSAILEVVSFLLLKNKKTGNYLLQPKERNMLLKKFVETFFLHPEDHDIINNGRTFEQIVGSISSNSMMSAAHAISFTTLVGRKAILLACEVILEDTQLFVIPNVEDDPQELDDTNVNILLLLRIAFALPHLLKGLGADYLFESSAIIMTLKLMSQRWYCYISSSTNMADPGQGNIDNSFGHCVRYFLSSLRRDMILILTSESRKSTKKKSLLSIFECYPQNMKRWIVGLISFLTSPKPEITDALAQICARTCYSLSSTVDDESIISYIFEALFLIRKSLSLTSYLNFLIFSCGIGVKKLNLTSAASDKCLNIFSFDFPTKCACRAIIQSGCTVILPHLKPLLLNCLQHHQSDVSKSQNMLLFSIRSRVSLMIISACSADLNNSHHTAASITCFIPEMIEIIGPLICDNLLPLVSNLELNKQDWGKVMRPVVSLLSHEPELMNAFASEALCRLKEPPHSSLCSGESDHSKRRLPKVEAAYLGELLLLNPEILSIKGVQSKALVDLLNEAINSF
jgi:hypothetical protein